MKITRNSPGIGTASQLPPPPAGGEKRLAFQGGNLSPFHSTNPFPPLNPPPQAVGETSNVHPDQQTWRLTITTCSIADVLLIESQNYADERGVFRKFYSRNFFKSHGLIDCSEEWSIAENPAAATLRGLHYQKPPFMEAKLVSCIQGGIFDVAVDIRKTSPTYGMYVALELRANSGQAIYIPPGFAHGYITLQANSAVLYGISPAYNSDAAAGIRWNDSSLNIQWPLQPEIISERDATLPFLKDIDDVA